MARKIKLYKEIYNNILNDENFVRLSEFTDLEIAEALLESYKDSVDYENDELKDFLIEISNIKKGLYGKYYEDLSIGIKKNGKLVSGLFVVIFRGEPTITYQFTIPEYRNLGLARENILKVENILIKKGYKYLYTYLTITNIPAYNLYDSLNYIEEIELD